MVRIFNGSGKDLRQKTNDMYETVYYYIRYMDKNLISANEFEEITLTSKIITWSKVLTTLDSILSYSDDKMEKFIEDEIKRVDATLLHLEQEKDEYESYYGLLDNRFKVLEILQQIAELDAQLSVMETLLEKDGKLNITW